MWVRAEASCDDGATHYTQFRGRVAPPEKRQQEQEPTELSVEVVGDDVRIRDHHTMWAHCSYEEWRAWRAYDYILARQNVSPAQRYVEPYILENEDDYMLPRAEDGGGRLQFDEQQTPIQALDAITAAVDLEWGWDGPNDRYFLRRPWEHTTGAYDLAIDQDMMDPDAGDVIYDLRHLQAVEDYANMVHVLAERGNDAVAASLVRWASINDPTDSAFVADDWLHIEQYEDAQAVNAIARRLWEKRGWLRDMAVAVFHDLPQIQPEWELQLTADVVDVTAGNIYMVDTKRFGDDDGWYTQTLDLVLVEEGSG
jgi:hypothetical protein